MTRRDHLTGLSWRASHITIVERNPMAQVSTTWKSLVAGWLVGAITAVVMFQINFWVGLVLLAGGAAYTLYEARES